MKYSENLVVKYSEIDEVPVSLGEIDEVPVKMVLCEIDKVPAKARWKSKNLNEGALLRGSPRRALRRVATRGRCEGVRRPVHTFSAPVA